MPELFKTREFSQSCHCCSGSCNKNMSASQPSSPRMYANLKYGSYCDLCKSARRSGQQKDNTSPQSSKYQIIMQHRSLSTDGLSLRMPTLESSHSMFLSNWIVGDGCDSENFKKHGNAEGHAVVIRSEVDKIETIDSDYKGRMLEDIVSRLKSLERKLAKVQLNRSLQKDNNKTSKVGYRRINRAKKMTSKKNCRSNAKDKSASESNSSKKELGQTRTSQIVLASCVVLVATYIFFKIGVDRKNRVDIRELSNDIR